MLTSPLQLAADEGPDQGGGTQTLTRPLNQTQPQTKTPPMYRVLILNDDYTPMDFVIHVLQKFFQKEYDEANRIMLEVHNQGAGVAGVYTHEIAETKVYHVNAFAKENQYPLKCTMEKI